MKIKKILVISLLSLLVFSVFIGAKFGVITGKRATKLLLVLPDYVKTPDAMAIDKYGNIVLTCPNFADPSGKPKGFVVKINKDLKVTKWFDVPVNPATGAACPMGVDFDSDGNIWLVDNQGWLGSPELTNQGRILKIAVDDSGNITKTTVVARNFEHPNGIKIKDGYAYVTASCISGIKRSDGLLVSGVYRFRLNEENVTINNNASDKNLLLQYPTYNLNCQYGLDGIVFDQKGACYVGNFGDGEVFRITFNPDGSVASNTSYAKDASQLETIDGMCFDAQGNLYIADFSPNAIAMISPDRKVQRIAQSPDNNGMKGGIDQAGEVIVWNGKLVFANFDMVTDDSKVNRKHEEPCTLGYLDLYK